MRTLTEDDWREIYEKCNGVTERIAAEIGVSGRTVRRHLTGMGICPRQQAVELPAEKVEWARKAAAEGMPCTWIGEELGITRERAMSIVADDRPAGANREWNQTWGWIKKQPHYLELHRELAPGNPNKSTAA